MFSPDCHHVAVCPHFLLLGEHVPPHGCVASCLSPLDGRFGCFPFQAILSEATRDVPEQSFSEQRFPFLEGEEDLGGRLVWS